MSLSAYVLGIYLSADHVKLHEGGAVLSCGPLEPQPLAHNKGSIVEGRMAEKYVWKQKYSSATTPPYLVQ